MMKLDELFDTFPTLETSQLILRNTERSDAKQLFSYFSQDIVTRYYDVETFDNINEAFLLINTFHDLFNTRKAIRWGIVLKENNRLIGTCGFHQIEEEHGKVELGYELDPHYWGKGLMTEAVTEIIKFGFNIVSINRIEAFFDQNNRSSEHLLKKCGFQMEGTLKQRFFEKGKYMDVVIASCLKSNYLE